MEWYETVAALLGAALFVTGTTRIAVHFAQGGNSEDTREGWDEPTSELRLWSWEDRVARQEQRRLEQKKAMTCPVDQGGCGGTRCHDWKVNGRVCGDNPTEAEMVANFLIGRHWPTTVEYVRQGYWPLARTSLGRRHPDLFRRIAGHCAITLGGPQRAVWVS